MSTAAVLVRLITCSSWKPSRPGSMMSKITKSGAKDGNRLSRSLPSDTAATWKPCADNAATTGSRIASLSSTTKIRAPPTRPFCLLLGTTGVRRTNLCGMADTAKRVAILGAGMTGEVHRRAALLAGAQVLGVMASSPERSRQVAEDWGVEQAYGSISEVADSKAEVVHICTPNASHVSYAVALMQAGKHVLCEKPLGVSVEDARHAAQIADDTGVINTIPFAYRFHPMVREMRARVQAED